jgi:hypothetical protein
MRCMVCGEEMQLVEAVAEPAMASGFEHHVLRCPACNDEERRLAFVQRPEQVPLAAEPIDDPATKGDATLQPSIETLPQPGAPQVPVAVAHAVPSKGENATARIKGRSARAKLGSTKLASAWDRSVATHRERWNALCQRLGLQVADGGATED